MKHPHIATGKHMGGRDPRFRINTAPGLMEPTKGINEAHGSYPQRHHVIELRDELNAWLEAHPTLEENVERIVGDALRAEVKQELIALIQSAATA
jgi:hypothetical protein